VVHLVGGKWQRRATILSRDKRYVADNQQLQYQCYVLHQMMAVGAMEMDVVLQLLWASDPRRVAEYRHRRQSSDNINLLPKR